MIKIYTDNRNDTFKVWKWLTNNPPVEFDAELGKTVITVRNMSKEEEETLWNHLERNGAPEEIAEMIRGK